jgi:predicted phosphodiesterase
MMSDDVEEEDCSRNKQQPLGTAGGHEILSIPTTIRPDGLTVICISDTHGQLHAINDIPAGDVIIHAGDSTKRGRFEELKEFYEGFGNLPHPVKLFVAGNHELTLDNNLWKNPRAHFLRQFSPDGEDAVPFEYNLACMSLVRSNACSSGKIRYLEDEKIEMRVEGSNGGSFTVYGSPWQPMISVFPMSFNLTRGPRLREVWERIPDDVDILVTHAPPLNILDDTSAGTNCGSEELRKTVDGGRIRPRLHVFGHVHESHGVRRLAEGGSLFVNAASCDASYSADRRPVAVLLPFDRSLPAQLLE